MDWSRARKYTSHCTTIYITRKSFHREDDVQIKDFYFLSIDSFAIINYPTKKNRNLSFSEGNIEDILEGVQFKLCVFRETLLLHSKSPSIYGWKTTNLRSSTLVILGRGSKRRQIVALYSASSALYFGDCDWPNPNWFEDFLFDKEIRHNLSEKKALQTVFDKGNGENKH